MHGAEDKTGGGSVARDGKGGVSEAAQRALAEAEERRRLGQLKGPSLPKEVDGRDGLDPARYGDWEVKGIASDF